MNERSTLPKRVLRGSVLAVVSCVALTGVAAAATNTSNQITVRYGDLNLSTEDGVRQLYGRIRAAAKSVCGAPYGMVTLTVKESRRQCVDEAVASAVKKVNNGILTAMHSGKSSRRFG
jgi:UrcA family protein